MKIIKLVPILALLANGCMKNQSEFLSQSTKAAVESIGCESMQSKVFDSMYDFLEKQNQIPQLTNLKFVLDKEIDSWAQNQNMTDENLLSKLKNEYLKIFEILIVDARVSKNIQNPQDMITSLIELEMKDQSTVTNLALNDKLSKQIAQVKKLSQDIKAQCQNPNKENINDAIQEKNDVSEKRMIAGLNNVFTTAYQSCQATQIPALDEQTPLISGITRLAQGHPDGIGSRRIVSNLSAVQQTHPYIRVSGSSSANGCFNVKNNPLIYDYGGEPSTTNNILNFFKDAGTGTSVLGIDCSSFVASAAAAGGLRYQPGLANKAIFVRQYSQKFINAKASNFTCYENITLKSTSTIKPGDIAAVQGHVLLIDQVGADPFGLKYISSLANCSQLSVSRFDFTLAQSSNSKNGIGLNIYVARDYLNESPKMKTLFMAMAQAACKARFQGTSIKPNSTEWGIIRHKGTSECLAPKIQMTGQSCVSQCQM